MTLVPGLTGLFLLFSMDSAGKLQTLTAACSSLLCLSGLVWITYTIAVIRFVNNGRSPWMARLFTWSSYLQLLSSFAVFALCITSYIMDKEKITVPVTTFHLIASILAILMGLTMT